MSHNIACSSILFVQPIEVDCSAVGNQFFYVNESDLYMFDLMSLSKFLFFL